ncbi:MAG: nuclear transport factor 2 family protein [Caldilineaceae bacterium]
MDISNTKHDRKTVIAAEQALAAAHLTLDVASIDRLLHPDYIIVQPGGTMEDKAQTLASFATGDRHWELAESDEMTVHLHGDTAVVTGRWRGRGATATSISTIRLAFSPPGYARPAPGATLPIWPPRSIRPSLHIRFC